MAIVYLRSTDGNDADDGSTWALADATLAASIVAAGAGGTSFVSDNHAETQASSLSIVSSGIPSNPAVILCVDDTGDPEPPTALAITAAITTTGASAMSIAGSFYCYGVTFNVGTGGTAADFNFDLNNADDIQFFEKCIFKILTTNQNAQLIIGSNNNALNGKMVWKDVDILMSHTGSEILMYVNLHWIGGSWLSGGTIPTGGIFISGGNNRHDHLLVENVDLSQIGASSELVDVGNINGNYIFRNCLLSASLGGFTTGAFPGPSGAKVIIENCDSGDTNYKFEHISYEGNVREETTIIRTGGASDSDTGFSMEMVSSANTAYPLIPLESLEIPVRIDSVGSSLAITVEIVHDSQGSGAGSDLQDDEIGLHVSFSDTLNSTQYTLNTSEKADYLAAATDYANSSETWTTTGLTTPVKQTLTVTMTPEEKGYYVIKVLLYKASSTVFVCPKVSVA